MRVYDGGGVVRVYNDEALKMEIIKTKEWVGVGWDGVGLWMWRGSARAG